jgi:Uma2 family endonuclease
MGYKGGSERRSAVGTRKERLLRSGARLSSFFEGTSTLASPARVDRAITLAEFLRMPEIDEHPYLEFVDGRIEAKLPPQGRHSRIETKLSADLDAYAERRGLGGAFVELRCTFAGRSIIPDIVFLREAHIETEVSGPGDSS